MLPTAVETWRGRLRGPKCTLSANALPVGEPWSTMRLLPELQWAENSTSLFQSPHGEE